MAEAKKGKKSEVPVLPAPIIIKKVQGDEGAAHGGAWKIALADMMTAMMAFFLLMWLLGATAESKRKSVADYFKPTPKSLVQMGQLAGSNGVLGGRSIMDPEGLPAAASQTSILDLEPPKVPEGEEGQGKGSQDEDKQGKGKSNDKGDKSGGKGSESADNQGKGNSSGELSEAAKAKAVAEQDQKNFDSVEQDLRQKLQDNKNLAALQGQVQFIRDKDGLRIEVIDKADFSMFALGTNKLLPRAQALLDEIAKSVAAMPNKVKVRGHTDSVPFANPEQKNNWLLSAERADQTRQLLEKRGVSTERFASIEGLSDIEPFIPADKADPRNRRISITLKYQGQ
jgi:chemotaxis protein MotB